MTNCPLSASNPLYYLTSLTSLLEAIAHIIDQHQPVVEKYYGTGRMGTVVGRLVGESDRVVRNLVEGWEEERRVGRLVSAMWGAIRHCSLTLDHRYRKQDNLASSCYHHPTSSRLFSPVWSTLRVISSPFLRWQPAQHRICPTSRRRRICCNRTRRVPRNLNPET
jgi:hypothetical protein